jgi:hypothetical protein
MGLSRPRSIRLRTFVILLVTIFASSAAVAFAGEDTGWGCYTVAPSYSCSDNYYHHFSGTWAYYGGSGDLPLFTGEACEDTHCTEGTAVFYSETGMNGNGYNSVYACARWSGSGCAAYNAPYLGIAGLTNEHDTEHNVAGTSYY